MQAHTEFPFSLAPLFIHDLPDWPWLLWMSLLAGVVQGPPLTCKWVMFRSMFMVDVSQFSEMYL